jgi:hypothetical protein
MGDTECAIESAREGQIATLAPDGSAYGTLGRAGVVSWEGMLLDVGSG